MDYQAEIKRAVDACASITGYLRAVLVAIGLVAAAPVALDIADLLLLREGPSLSAASPGEAAIISRGVMAKRLTPLSSTPLEVTDKFPPNQGVIHAVVTVSNAPRDTRLKVVWTAIDVGTVAAPNTKVGESESTTEGSGNVVFTWQDGSFPVGTYKVDIYLNGKPDRTLKFSVLKEAATTSGPAPRAAAIGSCPRLPPRPEKPPNFPVGVTMAQDTSAQRQPINPGRIFRPDSVFHAVLTTENAPANTRVAARWFVTDVGGVEPCNTEIAKRLEMVTAGSGNLDFTSKLPAGVKWPVGLYRVEIYVNGNLVLDTDFGVCEGSCKFEVPLSWSLR